ncbi:MAG: MutS-related protein [Candidatus Dormibacteria bacterium]
MKVNLMYRERDFEPEQPLPDNAEELIQDLDLATLFGAMARGDAFLLEVAQRGVLSSLTDPEAIAYRQEILADCLAQPEVIRQFYDLAVAALQAERQVYGIFRRSPSSVLTRSRQVLKLFVGFLRQLRQLADSQQAAFDSEGMGRLLGMLRTELDDAYFATVERHLETLELRQGVLISAHLGAGNKGEGYRLHDASPVEQSWLARLGIGGRSPYTIEVSPRDEAGARALGELTGQGINLVGNALAQSVDHILSFFTLLRAELGFYIGCLNLHATLSGFGAQLCTPEALPGAAAALSCRGLYDMGLALRTGKAVVANDLEADGKRLVLITGANSGGKSTFIRGIGLAQLLLQCGMFVAAESCRASVCQGVFTHFIREEDSTMTSGKLDEELGRMSQLADELGPGALVLFNESFAATNESEGSEVARQIVTALLESEIKVVYVTHLFDLVERFYAQQLDSALFLRAERLDDGRRTYKLLVDQPLPTSFGEDMYARLGGW